MTNDNYLVVQGWMVNDLKLSGNELLIYAIIYGFSQSGVDQKFTGSIRYLSEWTNTTRQTVMNCLKSLCEKGYIIKEESVKNGVKFCDYYAHPDFTGGQKILQGSQNSLPGGGQKSLPHNKEIQNKDHNKDYSPDPELNQAILDFLEYRKKIKRPMTARAIHQFMAKLDELGADTREKVDLINTALEHGWMTVYKSDRKPKRQQYGQQRQEDLDALIGSLYG